jgi:hypothetical protein
MSNDMQSIGEALDAAGYKPKREPVAYGPEVWDSITQDHWQAQKAKLWHVMGFGGVPQKYIAELSKPGFTQETEAISAVEQWLKSPSLMLVLTGTNQVGKSYACAYGLSTRTVTLKTRYGDGSGKFPEPWLEFRYVDGDFTWINAASLGALRDRYDPEVRARARRLETVKMLVIDELGAQTWDDVSKQLEDLLGKRWSANLRTMMTTNLNANGALQAALGDRIVERIRRVGKVVEVRGLGET